MEQQHKRSYCVDAAWTGRADCSHCTIRHLMLFSDLPDSAFDHHLSPIDNFIFPGGSALFTEGQDDGAVFSIRRGLVKLLSLTPDGDQRIVRLLGAGATIGLEILEAGTSYRHTAVTLNQVNACRIPASTMNSLRDEYPQLCQHTLKMLQNHLDRADQWIVTLGTGPARKRVARLLLLMLQNSTEPAGGIELLGRGDMAAIIGTSVETASRIVADMKRRHLLEKVSGNRYRCDATGLQAITDEE
jgi:CRP/FNR family transcriptional regulator